jgi:ATPase subunit of ABC transporter with duplicated ATPase domains
MPRQHNRPDSGMENASHPDFDPETGTLSPYPGGNEPDGQTLAVEALARAQSREVYALTTPTEARMVKPNEVRLVISGPCASGKTVLLSLIAHMINEAMQRHSLGPNIRMAYRLEEEFKSLEDTLAALKALTAEGGPGLSITMETVQTGNEPKAGARW